MAQHVVVGVADDDGKADGRRLLLRAPRRRDERGEERELRSPPRGGPETLPGYLQPAAAPTQIGISFERGPGPFRTWSRCRPSGIGRAARSMLTLPPEPV